MLKNICFDIDGTIVDTETPFYDSLKLTLEEYKIIVSDMPQGLFGKSVDEVIAVLGVSNDIGFKERWKQLFVEGGCNELFFNGMVECLSYLHELNYRIFLVTSRCYSEVFPLLTRSIISEFIDGYITADETRRHKPSPDPLVRAMEKYSLLSECTIYIGDTEYDYLAAREAGIDFALAAWNKRAFINHKCITFKHPMDIIICLEKRKSLLTTQSDTF